ncbi:hypothetical protein, partial [Bradyrhizobium sp.]|uniref:hypothetical protein n=1 Tax=Bradyrhizobium sp. TaxID=376 RepID=UPI002914DCB6
MAITRRKLRNKREFLSSRNVVDWSGKWNRRGLRGAATASTKSTRERRKTGFAVSGGLPANPVACSSH